VTGLELLAEHVERFNAGVRSGDFGPMLELFTDDEELTFVGPPVGPFHGREEIAAAYRDQPPDDQIEVLEASEDGDEVRARYACHRDEGRAAGDLRLTRAGDRISRLVVTFESRSKPPWPERPLLTASPAMACTVSPGYVPVPVPWDCPWGMARGEQAARARAGVRARIQSASGHVRHVASSRSPPVQNARVAVPVTGTCPPERIRAAGRT